MTKLRCMLCCLMICTITIDAKTVNDIYKRISAQVSLKVPGNQSRNYSLAFQGAVDDKGIYLLESEEKIPLIITERIERVNPEKPDVPLNKNDAFQKVQKRRVQEKR